MKASIGYIGLNVFDKNKESNGKDRHLMPDINPCWEKSHNCTALWAFDKAECGTHIHLFVFAKFIKTKGKYENIQSVN